MKSFGQIIAIAKVLKKNHSIKWQKAVSLAFAQEYQQNKLSKSWYEQIVNLFIASDFKRFNDAKDFFISTQSFAGLTADKRKPLEIEEIKVQNNIKRIDKYTVQAKKIEFHGNHVYFERFGGGAKIVPISALITYKHIFQ